MFERINFLADFARQIADIADGVKIGFKVVNVSDGEI